MKITTLLENKTTCDALRCEHGLSLYIETAKHKILFDSGASDAFWENAKALGIDLAQVDIAFLSHAHNDHCGGLLTFLRGNRTAKVYLQKEAFGDYYVVTPTKCAFIGLDPKLHEYADRFVMAEGVTKLDEELTLFSGIRTHELLSEANATLREKVGELIKEVDPRFTIHDFRMVEGPTHTNLIFDLVVPHKYPFTKGQIKELISDKILTEIGENYYAVMTIENSFVEDERK